MKYLILIGLMCFVWFRFQVTLSKMWLAFCVPFLKKMTHSAEVIVANAPATKTTPLNEPQQKEE
jgi:hypothetical protein